MSVVPYQKDLRVVWKHPDSRSVVLYSKENQSFQYISLDRVDEVNGADGDYFHNKNGSNQRRRSSTACPRCGFDLSRSSPESMFNNNYFKLLANVQSNKLSEQEKDSHLNLLNSTIKFPSFKLNRSSFPDNLFSQGYFAKFFTELNVLGHGSNGVVLKVEHVLNDSCLGVFALKKISIGEKLSNLENVLNEVKILYQLTNADVQLGGNLVSYNHVWLEVDQPTDFGPKVPCVFILFEYCDGGDLESFIDRLKHPKLDIEKEKQYRRMVRKGLTAERGVHEPRSLNDVEIWKLFKDITNGVQQLHSSHILHRDLKPSNCLLKYRYEKEVTQLDLYNDIPKVMVSDFGEGTFDNIQRSSSGYTGTLEFTAPEVFGSNYSRASDVYSLGLILYFLCFGDLPYKTQDIKREIQQYAKGEVDLFTKIDVIRDDISKDWVKLILECCSLDADKRPSASEILAQLNTIYLQLEAKEQNKQNVESSAYGIHLPDSFNYPKFLAVIVNVLLLKFQQNTFRMVTCFIIGLSFHVTTKNMIMLSVLNALLSVFSIIYS
ncbi:BA75_04196T0 [Komagataella pastoris]|uniref:BA75_04196T0 n=1 Tax=Komagataella pastoris TaxID=4922 RepID=A0A1B2JFI7_PICPA|nr:BA75_04196T0 [Komagataella pastoris]